MVTERVGALLMEKDCLWILSDIARVVTVMERDGEGGRRPGESLRLYSWLFFRSYNNSLQMIAACTFVCFVGLADESTDLQATWLWTVLI